MARHSLDKPQPEEEATTPPATEEPSRAPTSERSSAIERRDERRYQAIVELAPDALILSNAHGRIVLVNRQTERLFGYDRASLLGRPVEFLIPQRFHSRHIMRRMAYAEAPHARPMESGLQLFGQRSDGSEFPVEVSLSPLAADDADGEPLIIATVRDLSEQKRAKATRAALEAANRELRQLLEITDTALSTLAVDDLLRELLLRAREATSADNAAILLLDERGQELEVRAAIGPEEAVAGEARAPAGQGFADRIIATRAPLVVDNLSTFPVVNPNLRQLRSALGVPLLAGERLIGVLHVASMEPSHFSDQDVHLLELAGERIALAIDRARLHEATLAARADVERERARWLAAANHAPAYVLTCDADLNLTYINPAYERLLGPRADLSTPPEERPTRFGLLLPDGSGPIAPDEAPLVRAVRERRLIANVELLYRDPTTGEERLVLWNTAPMHGEDGSLLGAVSVGWDITEQRRLERAARDHVAQLEAIFEAISDGVVVYDTEGRIILSNAAARAQRDRIIPNAPGETLRERSTQARPTDEHGRLIPEEAWAQTRALRGEVVGGASPVEMVLHAPNGEVVIFRATAAPLRDATGRIIGAVTVNRDVTARKRLEREREEARARELAALEVSQRLDEFFAIAAHDIRNPVTTVYTSVQVAQNRLRRLRAKLTGGNEIEAVDLEALGDILLSARSDVERLIRLIDRLFDIAQARAGKLTLKLELCDLATIVSEQVAIQRAAHPEREIALAPPDDQPIVVNADADRLGEVLTNYLTNALKYAPPERPISVWLETRDGQARVAVRDEGPGLAPMERLLVWEMFHRAPEVEARRATVSLSDGLGLGLHICKRLVEAHPGGQVGVESAEGSGSTFWFSLPLAEDAAASLDS